MERLPFDLDIVADRVEQLDREFADVRFVVDAEGLGAALWTVLSPPNDPKRWQLYDKRGVERQALVDTLLVAISRGLFHFAANLVEQEAMTRALQGYRRQVREDGLIGSELVVALLLALVEPKHAPNTAWGWAPGSRPSDDLDGTVVGGIRLRRAADGSLVAVVQPKDTDDAG